MRFLIIYFFAIIPKKTQMILTQLKELNTFSLDNELLISNINNKINKNISGNDVRYAINISTNLNDKEIKEENSKEENRYKWLGLLNKKKLLDILENNKVSIPTKLDLIKENSIYPSNLTAGLKKEDYDFIL